MYPCRTDTDWQHDYDEPTEEPQPLPEISLAALDLQQIGTIDQQAYDDWVFVYMLTDNGQPFYVGTSTNPTLRLLAHLQETTKDTSARIGEMRIRGEIPRMVILDLTTRTNRIYLEARWIAAYPDLVNSSRYPDHAKRYRACPRCFRAASTGTLTGPIEQN